MTQQEAPGPTVEDPAEAIKSRLRTDLRSALIAKDAPRVRAARALIAAVDDAQAVPPADGQPRYVVHAFADRSAEVPRLRLTDDDVRRVVGHEAGIRTSAATEMERLGQIERARELRLEAAIITRYR
jgi:uncharacterized protein YqeY